MKRKIAGFYMDRFYALDNFSAFCVFMNGHDFMTAEHAYQFLKFELNEDQQHEAGEEHMYRLGEIRFDILRARSAHDAKRIAREHDQFRDPEWANRKESVMDQILRQKFAEHEYVQKTVARTEGLPIIETSPHDSFWGWGRDHRGLNKLGKNWALIALEELGLPIVEYVPDAA